MKKTITLNGAVHETAAATVAELLAETGFDGAPVATALNGTFLARGARAEAALGEGDRVEIVAPQQGG